MLFKKKKLTLDYISSLAKEALQTKDIKKFDYFMKNMVNLFNISKAEGETDTCLSLSILATDTFYEMNIQGDVRSKYLKTCVEAYIEIARHAVGIDKTAKAKLYYLEAIKLGKELYELTKDSDVMTGVCYLNQELAEIYVKDKEIESGIKYYRDAFHASMQAVRENYNEQGYGAMARSLYHLSLLGEHAYDNINIASNICDKLIDEYPNNEDWVELKEKVSILKTDIMKK